MIVEKNGREITKLAERFISLSSLLPVVCFLRDQSVFIMIARDSLSFGFSSFVCYEMQKGCYLKIEVPDADDDFVV